MPSRMPPRAPMPEQSVWLASRLPIYAAVTAHRPWDVRHRAFRARPGVRGRPSQEDPGRRPRYTGRRAPPGLRRARATRFTGPRRSAYGTRASTTATRRPATGRTPFSTKTWYRTSSTRDQEGSPNRPRSGPQGLAPMGRLGEERPEIRRAPLARVSDPVADRQCESDERLEVEAERERPVGSLGDLAPHPGERLFHLNLEGANPPGLDAELGPAQRHRRSSARRRKSRRSVVGRGSARAFPATSRWANGRGVTTVHQRSRGRYTSGRVR